MERRCRGMRAAGALAAVALLASGAVAASAGSAAAAEGRAYELVSPPDKNGNTVYFAANGGAASNATADPLLVAPDGDRATFGSTGQVGDAHYGGSGNFIAQRTAGGWVTSTVAPPRTIPVPKGLFGEIPLLYNISWTTSQLIFAQRTFNYPPRPGVNTVQLIGTSGDGSSPSLLSTGSAGQTNDGTVEYGGSSADGSHVVFSASAQLEPSVPPLDTPSTEELYERLPAQGTTRVVGVLPDGSVPSSGAVLGSGSFNQLGGAQDGRGQGDEARHAVSTDGRMIFFEAYPTSGAPHELYARIDGQRTIQLSAPTSSGGTAPSNGVVYQDASPDGSAVFFISDAQLTPGAPATGTSLYRYTFDAARDGGTLSLISAGVGADSAPDIGLVGASNDGQSGYFVSTTALGSQGTTGTPNLYRFDGGGVSFVATVSASDQLESTPTDQFGTSPYLAPQSRVTPDGSRVVFQSAAQLTSFDNAGHNEVYEAIGAGAPTCVSCGIVGGVATADASLTDPLHTPTIALPQNVSDDGQWIFFDSGDALVPSDINGIQDVYQWHDGTVSLVSAGNGAEPSTFIGASTDNAKRDVFFLTSDALVPQDVDTQIDLYDARVGGGFPVPPPAPAECSANCQGPASPASFVLVPGSSLVTGNGNATGAAAGSGRPTFVVGKLSASQQATFARTGRLTVAVRTTSAGKVSATVTAHEGKRWVKVGSASHVLSAAGSLRLKLTLSKAARASLAAHGRLAVRVDVRYSRARGVKRASFTLRVASARKGRRHA